MDSQSVHLKNGRACKIFEIMCSLKSVSSRIERCCWGKHLRQERVLHLQANPSSAACTFHSFQFRRTSKVSLISVYKKETPTCFLSLSYILLTSHP